MLVHFCLLGDVLSGMVSDDVQHPGLMQEWFGNGWWTTRSFVLIFTTVFVFAPLI